MRTKVPLAFLCVLFSLASHAKDGDLAYLKEFDFEAEELKIRNFGRFSKTKFLGRFLHKANTPPTEKDFGDVRFTVFRQHQTPENCVPQLTLIFPNLSPIRAIEQKLAKRLAELGSDVIVLETGITWMNYGRKLADFNHLLSHQLLASHYVINYYLESSKISPKRVQVFGSSLGGVLSAAFLAIDERAAAGITFLGGAGYRASTKLGIIADVTRLLTGRSKDPSPGIAFDAKDLKQELKGKRIKIYRTSKDLFVPPERQDDLIQAADRPLVHPLKGQHLLNVLRTPRKARDFFDFFNQAGQ